MEIDLEQNWQGKMAVEISVQAGQYVSTQISTVLVFEQDDKLRGPKISKMCSTLLNSLPLAELHSLEQQYVKEQSMPVVKVDGTPVAITPEIARAATEQQKLRKTMEKSKDESGTAGAAKPSDPPVL